VSGVLRSRFQLKRPHGEEWTAQSFMAIGAKDVETTKALHGQIRGCPEPLVVTEAGHFLQEWGEPVARAALRSFGDLQ